MVSAVRLRVEAVEEWQGIPVFRVAVEAGPVRVGDRVWLRRPGEPARTGLVCGVLVGGKSLDVGEVGTTAQVTIRGEAADAVAGEVFAAEGDPVKEG